MAISFSQAQSTDITKVTLQTDQGVVYEKGKIVDFKTYTPRPGQISKDGLHYYISLDTKKSANTTDLYVLSRNSLSEQFDNPQLLTGTLNDKSLLNIQPSLTADEKTIVFVRNNSGSWSENNLFIANRENVNEEFTNVEAISELNTSSKAESYPWISPDGLTLYFTSDRNGSDKIYTTTRTDLRSKFGPATLVDLEPRSEEILSCYLSNDMKTIWYISKEKVFYSTRSSVNAEFTGGHKVELSHELGFISGISLTPDLKQIYMYNSDDVNLIAQFKTENPLTEILANVVKPRTEVSTDPLLTQVIKAIDLNKNVVKDGPLAAIQLANITDVKTEDKTNDRVQNEEILPVITPNVTVATMEVYPNPVSTLMNVKYQLPENEHLKAVTVMNIAGMQVKQLDVTGFQDIFSVDASDLSPGTYILALQTDGTSRPLSKFMVTR